MVYEYSSDEQLQNKLEGLQREIENAKAEQKRRGEMKKNPKPDEVGLSSPCKSPTVKPADYPADYPECTKNLIKRKRRSDNVKVENEEKVEENTDADDTEENVELKVTEKPNCESCKYKEECVKREPPVQNKQVVQSTPPVQNNKVVKPKRRPRKNAGKKAHEKRSIKPMNTIVETAEEPGSPPPQPGTAVVAEPTESVNAPVETNQPVRTVKLTDVSINSSRVALIVVFEFLNYAQTKGIFSIEECAKIWECRKMFSS